MLEMERKPVCPPSSGGHYPHTSGGGCSGPHGALGSGNSGSSRLSSWS